MMMRFGIFVLAAQFTFCLSAHAQDYLEPEEGILSQPSWILDYAKQVHDILLKDAPDFHLARMVCLPAFGPEWVVTVDWEEGEDSDAPYTYYVEYVIAEEPIFRAKDPKSLTVKKSRATLDEKTAKTLIATWRRILRTLRYPKAPRVGADGWTLHFSRSVAMTDRGAGREQGTIWAPDEKSLCGEFEAIGERLRDYALAKPEDREKIRAELRDRVDKFAVKLERRGRGADADPPGK